jgi:hypothetical protein
MSTSPLHKHEVRSSMEMGTVQSKGNESSSATPTNAQPSSKLGPLQSCMEREPGIVLASDDGFFGPDKKHIITYDATKMRT